MRLTHHAREWRGLDRTRVYDNRPGLKPIGLWLSVDGEWETWCQCEEMDWLVERPIEFEITKPDSILTISTADELQRFTSQFSDVQSPLRLIHWNRVVDEYAGMMLSPYWRHLAFTPEFLWYYAWDCASAVIWDLSAVQETGSAVKL